MTGRLLWEYEELPALACRQFLRECGELPRSRPLRCVRPDGDYGVCFMKIMFIGLGLIGGSMALALKGYTDAELYGVDRDGQTRLDALSCGTHVCHLHLWR